MAMAKFGAAALVLSALTILPIGSPRAATYTLVLDTLATGTENVGQVTATFTDVETAPGGVVLAIDATGLVPSYIADIYFNFTGTADQLAALTFTRNPAPASTAPAPTIIEKGVDLYAGQGASGTNTGMFDIHFGFSTSNKKNGLFRFDAGEILSMLILPEPLEAALFLGLSESVNGGETYSMVAKIQGLLSGGSVRIGDPAPSTVPVPAALPLFGTALACLFGSRLYRRRKRVSATA